MAKTGVEWLGYHFCHEKESLREPCDSNRAKRVVKFRIQGTSVMESAQQRVHNHGEKGQGWEGGGALRPFRKGKTNCAAKKKSLHQSKERGHSGGKNSKRRKMKASWDQEDGAEPAC
eukprot:1159858-Pelagomonas_calceolata.AAC.7